MNGMGKAACVVALMAAISMSVGCGTTFRPVTTTLPVNTGNPSGVETEVVLNQCPTPGTCSNGKTGMVSDSILTAVDVAGDFNAGNRPLQNRVGSVVAGTVGGVNVPAAPMAFDASRTMVLTANTATDSLSELHLGITSGGFATGTTTVTTPAGSAPTGVSFQFFGGSYTQDFAVYSGPNAVCPTSGSLGVLDEGTGQLKATVCVGPDPVAAWIFHDQSKVFVLDDGTNPGTVYVVDASSYKVTHTFSVGTAPMKVAQDSTGQYLYVLNVGDGSPGSSSISILDGQNEQLLQTVPVSGAGVCGTDATPYLCDSPVIDMAADTTLNDTNPDRNRLWLLHANGTVSVWDGTTPGQLSWITSVPTITTAQAAATPAAYPTNLALLRDLSYAYVGIGNTDQIVAIDASLLHHGEITPGAESTASFPATTSITVGTHRSVTETLTNTETQVDPTSGAVSVVQTYSNTVPVEETEPFVTSVGVSRAATAGTTGNSAVLSKAYATTVTKTRYYCYDDTVSPVDCQTTLDCNSQPQATLNPWTIGSDITTVQTTDACGNPSDPPPPGSADFLAAGCVNNGDKTMTCPDLYNGTSVVSASSQTTIPVNTLITTLPAPEQVLYCDAGNASSGAYDIQKNCPLMQPEMVIGRN